MDLKALQAKLRAFAAERDWQAFHTPKNLAMALMVEAAELAEIFQWLTPEQSLAAGQDPVLHERMADALADVLLYGVQIADRAGVDLQRAVARKLVKNAKKHPVPPGRATGTRAGAATPTQAAKAATTTTTATASAAPTATPGTHVLLDWENVQPGEVALRALVPGVSDVWLFHGPHQRAFAVRHASFGDRLHTIKIARTGRNALDFHLSFYLGRIAVEHPGAHLVVVSNDQGYASMLEHAATLGFAARQIGYVKAAAGPADAPTKAAARTAARKAVAKVQPDQATSATAPRAGPAAAKKAPAVKPTAKAGPGQNAAGMAPPPPLTPLALIRAAGAKRGGTTSAPAKSASAKAVPAKGAARSAPPPPVATQTGAAFDLDKAVRHVTATLGKTTGKPARRARLVAAIQQMLGTTAEDPNVEAVLYRLLASGQVRADDKGVLRYPPPGA